MSRAAVVDVCMDDDFNIFALGSLAGRPHVMSCSLFGQGRRSMTLKYLNEAILFLIRHFEFKRDFNCVIVLCESGEAAVDAPVHGALRARLPHLHLGGAVARRARIQGWH